jgi:aspartate 1-decarboxylase
MPLFRHGSLVNHQIIRIFYYSDHGFGEQYKDNWRFIHHQRIKKISLRLDTPNHFLKIIRKKDMLLHIHKSKIHRVKVTQANLNYVGSITIDEDIMDAANIYESEKVQIVNNNNGERFETYVIKGQRGSGMICLNGAAARRAEVGDIVIIITYALMTPEEALVYKPVAVFPDENNQLPK